MDNSSRYITYIFGAGRLEKLDSGSIRAREFFYGYQFLSNDNNMQIIEMQSPDVSQRPFLNFIDKVLRKLTKLPIYTKDILFYKNYKTLKKTEKLIVTTDLLALSVLPFLLIIKILYKIEIFVIVMGLFGREPKNKIIKFFQNFYIGILLKLTNEFIFLGKGEYLDAKLMRPRDSEKFIFLPFCVDTDFWKPDKSYEHDKRNGILFIGNDGKRDFKLIEKIAKSLPEIEFTFITSQIRNTSLPNVNLIKGNWGKSILTDSEILNFYLSSRLTIIPLKNTLQPSGQTVALQSMACGTPVMISETKGFWDKDKFKHRKNILFVNNADVSAWIEEVRNYYYDPLVLKSLSENSLETINDEYKLENFDKNLKAIIYG